MNTIRNLLAGLLLACLLAAPLMASSGQIASTDWGAIATVLLIGAGLAVFGTVTVTYEYPVQSTVAPTVSQMKPLSLVTAFVNWGADSDTLALVTHNFQLGTIPIVPTTAPSTLVTELSCLFPLASWYYTAGGSNTTIINGSNISSSVFQLTKANAASSAGTLIFFCLRPWTGLR